MIKIDFLKKKKVFIKDNVQPNPEPYWMGIFFLGFVFTIVAFIFGLFVFQNINKDEEVNSPINNKQLQKISKKRLDNTLSVFSDRQKVVNDIIKSSAGVVDPSL